MTKKLKPFRTRFPPFCERSEQKGGDVVFCHVLRKKLYVSIE